MKRLVALMLLITFTAFAGTGPYTLILITQGRHFEPQLGLFENLRECKSEGIELVKDHDVYIGFGCVRRDRH